MDKSMILQEITEEIADKGSYAHEEIDSFFEVFFKTIENGLLVDKFVKIKGFGTFKLVSVSDRESIDVNTGERIQINGHVKVSFVPDNDLKDLINSPFSHFQTIVIDKSLDLEKLVDADGYSPLEETGLNAKEAENNPPLAPECILADEKDCVESGKSNDVIKSKQEDLSENSICTPTIEQNEKSSILPSSNVDVVHSLNTEPESSKTVGETLNEGVAQEKSDEELSQSDSYYSSISHTINRSYPFKYVLSVTRAMKSPNWWKLVAILLLVFILLVLSYFAGYYKLFCPPCQEGVSTTSQTDKVDCSTFAMDSLKEDNISQKSAMKVDNQKNITKADLNKHDADSIETVSKSVVYTITKKYSLDGTMCVHKVLPNETLSSIAQKMYGHKEFSSYIIRYNHIPNPNNIVVGSVVKVPKLKEIE